MSVVDHVKATAAWTAKGRALTAARYNAATDPLARLCGPVASRWEASSVRRHRLRTDGNLKLLRDAQTHYYVAKGLAAKADANKAEAYGKTRNPFRAEVRKARATSRATRAEVRKARTELNSARRNYPPTATAVAACCHALHAGPATAATLWTAATGGVAWWPVAVSSLAVAGHAAVLRLGRRYATAPVAQEPDDLSPEERSLFARLDPAYWTEHAKARGLEGTVPGNAKLSGAGIRASLRLDGEWSLARLKAKADNVRALLGVQTDTVMTLSAGKDATWAVLKLMTRSPVPKGMLAWDPEHPVFGLCTVTGEPVILPLEERLLIAGMSGAGKSVATRPLLYTASESPVDRLIIIDLKMVEARLWDHRARVATDPDSVTDLVAELVEEMFERLSSMPKGMDKLEPTEHRPRLTLLVDEGSEVNTSAPESISGLETLARLGRAAQIHVVWCTQKPTTSGKDAGIPTQIAAQMGTRISLKVSTPTEARTVLGEDANAKGWNAEELPRPGFALVRDDVRSPDPVKVAYMDKEVVLALPPRLIWHRKRVQDKASWPAAADGTRVLTVTIDDVQGAAEPVTGSAAAVLEAIQAADRSVRQKEVAQVTGLTEGTVSKAVRRLIDIGRIYRNGDGSLLPIAP